MREICHLQAGQCGNQIGAKVGFNQFSLRAQINSARFRGPGFDSQSVLTFLA